MRESLPSSAFVANNRERRPSLHGYPNLPHPCPSPGGRGVYFPIFLGAECTPASAGECPVVPSAHGESPFSPSPHGRGIEGEGVVTELGVLREELRMTRAASWLSKPPSPRPSPGGRGVYFPIFLGTECTPASAGECPVVPPAHGESPFFPLPPGEGSRVRESLPSLAFFAKNCEWTRAASWLSKPPSPLPLSRRARGVLPYISWHGVHSCKRR